MSKKSNSEIDKAVNEIQFLCSWQNMLNSVEQNRDSTGQTKDDLKEIKEKIKRVTEE